MEWRQAGGLRIGGKQVPVRSLRVPDETGRTRRLRTCTVWNLSQNRFSRAAAVARLVRMEDGRIGVLVTGRHQAYVKIGKNFMTRDSLVVPCNMLSKKAVRALVRGTGISLEERDGVVIAYDTTEKDEQGRGTRGADSA